MVCPMVCNLPLPKIQGMARIQKHTDNRCELAVENSGVLALVVELCRSKGPANTAWYSRSWIKITLKNYLQITEAFAVLLEWLISLPILALYVEKACESSTTFAKASSVLYFQSFAKLCIGPTSDAAGNGIAVKACLLFSSVAYPSDRPVPRSQTVRFDRRDRSLRSRFYPRHARSSN